ncbi:hypothetical protein A2U01_0067416 [Trifolium medium]|uniref:Uncharacterized protein n=1 Tax=Trifolium medium TaxID=97028 RepID=A0A392SE92_9FABA|nr:hypothetical protein [Trifolium medium]
MGEMSRTKLLQVTRAVAKEVKGGSGYGYHRGPRSGNGPFHKGSNSSARSGSDWVFVKD